MSANRYPHGKVWVEFNERPTNGYQGEVSPALPNVFVPEDDNVVEVSAELGARLVKQGRAQIVTDPAAAREAAAERAADELADAEAAVKDDPDAPDLNEVFQALGKLDEDEIAALADMDEDDVAALASLEADDLQALVELASETDEDGDEDEKSDALG